MVYDKIIGILEKINFPDSIEVIGGSAFSTTGLSNIKLPESVEALYDEVFGDTNIEEIIIPDSVKEISSAAFEYRRHSTPLKKIYCEASFADQCEAAVREFSDVSVVSYQKNADGTFFYNNKWYQNSNQILSDNNIKKRIYTIDEANKVSGRKNTFKIRYK